MVKLGYIVKVEPREFSDQNSRVQFEINPRYLLAIQVGMLNRTHT